MRLEHLSDKVIELFSSLDTEIGRFQSLTSLHCSFGCGQCCFKPDIEATILEFLPFALHLYKAGKATEWHDKVCASEESVCLILNPTSKSAGLCSEYTHRGLICRLFGYSARTNKHGVKELITCSIIKSEQTPAFEEAQKKIAVGLPIPVMNQYYMQLTAIDDDLSREFFPINVAIRKAIETVLHYYSYREESGS